MTTIDDLHRMPEDGRRHEVLNGSLIVTPLPDTRHQKAVVKLMARLDEKCPDDLCVLPGPFAVRPSRDTELRPDVLVARNDDLTEDCLPVPPVLVVEVLTEHTALFDRYLKRAAYERLGVPSYWVFDPAELVLSVFEFGEQVAEVKGDDAFDAERPYPVRIVPAELLGTLR